MANQLVSRFFDHQDFTPKVDATVRKICREYGFDPTETIHRRYIYDPDKLWRVRLKGVWQKLPAMLRIENIRLETDEESIRKSFRSQCKGSDIRPPLTYISMPYDEADGCAFSIEEYVEGEPLFQPAGSAENSWSFIHFYRKLRELVTEPFWPCPQTDARDCSIEQMSDWYRIAARQFPERMRMLDKVTSRLLANSLDLLGSSKLVFQHAHLTGADIRETARGEYIVFANHFWRWGQPAFDVVFPMWNMWLALPPKRRNPEEIRHITDHWLTMIRSELNDLIGADETLSMVLNRLYGALTVDVPAKYSTEKPEDVQALDHALMVEADRILTAIGKSTSLP